MAVIAPPRQPDSRDAESTVEPDRGGEALIEEAKQHARQRRRRVTVIGIVATLAVAGAVTAALVAGGAGSSSSDPSSIEADAEGPAVGAPPEDSVELIAEWSEFHRGWVRIYADGRVHWEKDDGRILERRLTSAGVALVRSGALTARDIDSARDVDNGRLDRLPTGTWAEAEFHPYAPSAYALCFWVQLELTGYQVPATTAVAQLPPAAQALVRGTQQHFDVNWVHFPDQSDSGAECFRLTPEIVDTVLVSMDLGPRPGEARGKPQSPEAYLRPVMPDGSLLSWGG